MNIIKLTNAEHDTVYVNFDQILYFREYVVNNIKYSKIRLADGFLFDAIELPEQILELIS